MSDLTTESENLGAGGFFGTDRLEPIGAVTDYLSNICKSFNIVDDSRTTEQTLYCRERRTGTRLTAVTFDRCEKCSLFAADKRACAETKLDIKIESGAENILTEHAVFSCLLNCDLKSLDCDRILCADIDIAFIGTDRIAGDSHCFKHGMRVAFKD